MAAAPALPAAAGPPLTLSGRAVYDCAPGLTDDEVLRFCKDGFLKLDGVVDAATSARCVEFLDNFGERMSPALDEPVEIFSEPWFVTNVLLNPA
eukprot:SAG22_NODE_15125_length_356_cov_0.809339_1_plen_93_part_10